MNYLGLSFDNSDILNLQSQIDAINAQITTINTTLTSLQSQITTNSSDLVRLNHNAVGNFTPFNFTSTVLTDLTPQMLPVIGSGLFIPSAQCKNGMCIRIKVFTALQCNYTGSPNQLSFFIAQDTLANYTLTNTSFENIPLITSTAGRIYIFDIIITNVAASPPVGFSSMQSGATGALYYGNLTNGNPLSVYGGLTIKFLCQWNLPGTSSANNFTVDNVTIEQVANFY